MSASSVKPLLTPNGPEPAALEWVRPGSREDRARTPRARAALRDLAIEFGVCVRPVLLRRTDLTTGETAVVETPCGSTRAAVCPPCAVKALALRAQQCREGWHLTDEPDLTPDPAPRPARDLLAERADLVAAREDAADDLALHPDDQARADVLAAMEAAIADLDEQLGRQVKGSPEPDTVARRARSTRRRADVPDLPRTPSNGSSLGRVYDDPRTGARFRPSLFLTVTLDSYGPVLPDGTPVDPGSYDYVRAARDALHFGKALDRLVQNLRRVAGYDLQYFAAVEPQRRLAPHAHFAIRGTLPRAVVRQVAAATYANVWWPTYGPDRAVYDAVHAPVWVPDLVDDDGRATGGYVNPDTGAALPSWRDALDQLDAEHATAGDTGEPIAPVHCVRFGRQVDVKGVLAGSPQAEKAIGYLVKYLVKDLGDDLVDDDTAPAAGTAESVDGDDGRGDDVDEHGRRVRRSRTREEQQTAARRAEHRARLVEALRWEPCSPGCANWLRYGIQPKGAKPGMRPGACKRKAHRPTHLGYGGRRVLASRKWTAKDLTDHRIDRRAHVLAVLGKTDELAALQTGAPTSDTRPVAWELARPNDPDVKPRETRLYLAIAAATARRIEYRTARDRGDPDHETGCSAESSATTDPAADTAA